MTVSTYSVDSALQAYSKQNRVRIKADYSPGSAGQRSSIDSVSISEEAGSSSKSSSDRPFYTMQEIISRKLIPDSGTPDNSAEETHNLSEAEDSLS